jgi:uncharacterized protein
VMEREIFENLSIASLMNKHFICIKLDREEHPDLDEIYMVARQLMTHEGGWPNHVWLTPDLKPFYAGGTYAPDESYPGKPPFPHLLEWLNYSWTTQEAKARAQAENIMGVMQDFLVQKPENSSADAGVLAHNLLTTLAGYHDARSGGFFQAPKFPHEPYVQFLLDYHRKTGDKQALDIAAFSLGKMAAGGLYDQVGCGFHRYAVDKEWYVPHFEKMLYNQALLARVYTDAADLTKNEYLADIAKSVLDFTRGPLTDANGAFYAGIDAETDGVEGAYYAWSAEEITALLEPEERDFFISVYALADIPAFPGHKHPNGQSLILRKPLAELAVEKNIPYVQLAAMCGQLMNKLLTARNQRKAPNLDHKIITSWNGLMIDAYAHAGKIFGIKHYVNHARKAADYLLQTAIDNDGELHHVVTGGKAQIAAMLEDYAYLVKGTLSLYRAGGNKDMLDISKTLMQSAKERFFDEKTGGYFQTQAASDRIIRVQNADDSALPNANAVMLANLLDLHDITGEDAYRAEAEALAAHFLPEEGKMLAEYASFIGAAMRMEDIAQASDAEPPQERDDVAHAEAERTGNELRITLFIKKGWVANGVQLDVQGEGMINSPEIIFPEGGPDYAGKAVFSTTLPPSHSGPLRVLIRFQPCFGTSCHALRDIVITV